MKATLRVQTDRVLGHASELLRGMPVENHHRCIEGGLYEPGSPLADERGWDYAEVVARVVAFHRERLDAVPDLCLIPDCAATAI